MPNSLQSSAIASPASHKLQSFIHYRTLLPRHHSLPFYGEKVLPTCPVQCVTYVSGRSVCLLALRLPAIGGCCVQAFRDLHGPLIFLPGLPEHPFFHSGAPPDFPRGQTRRGPGSRRRRRVALGSFPSAIMIPFEWIWDTSLSALLAARMLWATLELADSDRVRDWCGYGLLCGFSLMTNPSLENYDDKHSRFSSHITKDRETARYFRMGETPLMDEERRKAMCFIISHPRIELILRRSLLRVLDRPSHYPAELSGNGFLIGSRLDALRRSFWNGSAPWHRRPRSTPQRLRVSTRRLPGRVSFFVLHHAHFASLPASHRFPSFFC